jgi:hypothetical protein
MIDPALWSRVVPLAPPPSELARRALEVAANLGLQVEFSTTITEEGLLVWCVEVDTERGTLRSWPKDLTQDAWLECLNGLGLIRG